jgi:hypothetical protein
MNIASKSFSHAWCCCFEWLHELRDDVLHKSVHWGGHIFLAKTLPSFFDRTLQGLEAFFQVRKQQEMGQCMELLFGTSLVPTAHSSGSLVPLSAR